MGDVVTLRGWLSAAAVWLACVLAYWALIRAGSREGGN